MLAAAEAGCRDYDLWGIPPAPDPSHPWFGLWQFKTGFGGRRVDYAGAWELRLSRLAGSASAALDGVRARMRAMRRR
jgi:lipid II:glycine glycyltransferase (peptidoglycan interpeptide bridge formation enzyme)